MENPRNQVNFQKIQALNRDGMTKLHQQDFKQAYQHFIKARFLLQQSPILDNQLLLVTLNNLGCYYKTIGEYIKSLQVLQQALEIQPLTLSDQKDLANTHLNISAVKSLVQDYRGALHSAENAVKILNQLLQQNFQSAKISKIIALKAVAQAKEKLNKKIQAQQTYRSAIQTAKLQFGQQHQVTSSLIDSCKALNSQKPISNKKQILPTITNFKNFLAEPTKGKMRLYNVTPKSVRRPSPNLRLRSVPKERRTVSSQYDKQVVKRLDFLETQLNYFTNKYQKFEKQHRKVLEFKQKESQEKSRGKPPKSRILPKVSREEQRCVVVVQKV